MFKNMKTFLSNYLFCFKLMFRTNRLSMFILLFLTTMTSLIPFVGLYLSKLLIDELLAGFLSENDIQIRYLFTLLFIYFGVNCLSSFLNQIINKFYGIVRNYLAIDLNISLMKKSADIDISYFDIPKEYEDVNRSMSNAFSLNNVVYDTVGVFECIVSLIGAVVLAIQTSVVFVILSFIIIIPYFIISKKYQKKSYQFTIDHQRANRKKSYLYSLFFTKASAKELSLFSAGETIYKDYLNMSEDLVCKELKFQRKSRFHQFLSMFPMVILEIGIKVFTIISISKRKLTVGSYMYVTDTFSILNSSIIGLVERIAMYIGYNEKIKDYRKYFDLRTSEVKSGDIRLESIKEIRFENVSFTYPNSTHPALQNVSFSANTREKMMLVGVNGSGKTTIHKLLCRFYDASSGQIYINGYPIETLNIDSLREHMACVFQDFNIYSLSIRENVAIGDLSKLDQEDQISDSLKIATFSNKSFDENEDIDLMIGKNFDGIELSGGERQKLAIARAAIRDSSVIILDEPTASLDPEAEYYILQNFSKLYHQKTLLMISHRLSNSRQMGKIIVLEGGTIIEMGDHATLMKKQGRYYEFYQLHASKYQS